MLNSGDEYLDIKNGMFGKGHLQKGESAPRFVGYYATPLGKFASSVDAAEIHKVHPCTIVERCRSKSEKFKNWSFEPK